MGLSGRKHMSGVCVGGLDMGLGNTDGLFSSPSGVTRKGLRALGNNSQHLQPTHFPVLTSNVPRGVIPKFQAIEMKYFYLQYATSSMLLWRYLVVLCLRVKKKNFKQTHSVLPANLHTCISPHRYKHIGRLITLDKADNAGEDLFMRGIVDITQGIFTEQLGLFSTCLVLKGACSKSARTSLQMV